MGEDDCGVVRPPDADANVGVSGPSDSYIGHPDVE